MKPLAFEKDGHFYLVTPVVPFDPSDADVDELAFASEVKRMAPNAHLGWLHGRFVEADRPNANGQFWATKELEIASLTPMLMPVTVMHDPATAVGMIADAKLVPAVAESAAKRMPAQTARIDTTLGIWKHRFPEVWAEVEANHEHGGLMQSMECRPAYYDCAECAQRFPVLPGREEAKQWCAHLKEQEVAAGVTRATRRLGNVTFTGTGLIFGTRGAKGALDTAHLDVFREEVAEFHHVQRDSNRTTKQKQRRKGRMEIDDKRYEELVAAEQAKKGLEARVADLEPVAAKVPDLERDLEAEQIAKKAAEDLATEEKGKRERLEETARAATLAGERTGKLGSKFVAKLPASIKTRLDEQAKTLSEDDWTARLDELSQLVGVKSDEQADGSSGGSGSGEDEFSADELAGAGFSGTGGNGGSGEVSPERRKSVIGGLAKLTAGRS